MHSWAGCSTPRPGPGGSPGRGWPGWTGPRSWPPPASSPQSPAAAPAPILPAGPNSGGSVRRVIRRAFCVLGAGLIALTACTAPHPADSRSSERSPSRASSASEGPPAGTTTPAARRTATVLGSGDVLPPPPLWQQAHADARAEGHAGYDFGPMYASVAPDVRNADLATCELETPLAPPQGPFAGWPDFSAPPQVLTALKGVGYR